MSDTTSTTTTPTRAEVLAAAQRFADMAQSAARERFKREGLTYGTPHVILDTPGPKYVRVIKFDVFHGQDPAKAVGRSVHAFVDLTNGNVLKAASWKAPAKGARGNVFKDEGKGALSSDGSHVWYAK